MHTLPTFESLSAEEVNDLLATKLMGWRPGDEYGDTSPGYYYDVPNDTVYETHPNCDCECDFNPFYNLNDVHLCEERLRADKMLWQQYVNNLMRELLEIRHAIHATAQQRCHALLLTIGVIQ